MKLPYNNTNIFVFYFDPLFIRLHRSALPLPLLSSPCLSSLPLCLCCCRRRCFSPPVVVMPTSQEMALSWLHSSRADQLMSGTVQACAQIPPPTLLPSPPPPPSVNVVVVPPAPVLLSFFSFLLFFYPVTFSCSLHWSPVWPENRLHEINVRIWPVIFEMFVAVVTYGKQPPHPQPVSSQAKLSWLLFYPFDHSVSSPSYHYRSVVLCYINS